MATVIDALRARFGDKIRDSNERLGDETVVIDRRDAIEIFRFLREDPAMSFELLVDATAVDYLGRRPRFEMVYQLASLAHRRRVRVKVPLEESDCWMPTLSSVWKGANWLEREAFDMFGVRFEGHPDLRRILMYPQFEGYPLRKDYPVMKRQPIVPERDPVENPWPPRAMGAKR